MDSFFNLLKTLVLNLILVLLTRSPCSSQSRQTTVKCTSTCQFNVTQACLPIFCNSSTIKDGKAVSQTRESYLDFLHASLQIPINNSSLVQHNTEVGQVQDDRRILTDLLPFPGVCFLQPRVSRAWPFKLQHELHSLVLRWDVCFQQGEDGNFSPQRTMLTSAINLLCRPALLSQPRIVAAASEHASRIGSRREVRRVSSNFAHDLWNGLECNVEMIFTL